MATFRRIGLIGLLVLSATVTSSRAGTCVSDPASTTTVCASWDQGGEPVHNFHFVVDFQPDPTRPTVELNASATWRLYTIDSAAPGGLGDLGQVVTDFKESVDLLLANPDGSPAVRDIYGITMVYADGQTGRILPGSRITGSVRGTIFMRGINPATELHLQVDGDVLAGIDVDAIRNLHVAGSAHGVIATRNLVVYDSSIDHGI
jgi:hypothetical protein